jgi:hypothetical protein
MKQSVHDPLNNTIDDPTRSVELVLGDNDLTSVTQKVSDIVLESKTPLAWYVAFTFFAGLTGILFLMIAYLFVEGVGVWGLNNPVGWGWAIVNFVFWVGIGHAGTLISAILFLLRQKWRTSINRFAEAMTIFAVVCAGIFPGIHVGRVWVVYWLFPLPNYQAMWPNFRSPLLWDVFAVGTYATVSLLFWYTGMVPDLATLRDRARNKVQQILRLLGPGLARQPPPLAPLREGLPAAGRSGHAAGAVGALGGVLRLRHQSAARLAHDHLPALLRGRRRVQRLRHGGHAAHSGAPVVRPEGDHHAPSPGEHEQDHPGHRFDGRLRLRHRVLHRLVRRQPLRELRLRQPGLRSLRLGLLDHGQLQRHHPAALLVQEDPHQHSRSCGCSTSS